MGKIIDFFLNIADDLDSIEQYKQADIVSGMAVKYAKVDWSNVGDEFLRNMLYNKVNQNISGGKKTTDERSKEALAQDIYNDVKAYVMGSEFKSYVKQMLNEGWEESNILDVLSSDVIAERVMAHSDRMQNVDWETSGGYTEGFLGWFEGTEFYSRLMRLAQNVISNISQGKTSSGRIVEDDYEADNKSTTPQPQAQPQVQPQAGSNPFIGYLNQNKKYILDTFDKNTDEYEEVNSQNAYALFRILWPKANVNTTEGKQYYGMFYNWLANQYSYE